MKKIAHHERNNFESGRGVSLEFWVGETQGLESHPDLKNKIIALYSLFKI